MHSDQRQAGVPRVAAHRYTMCLLVLAYQSDSLLLLANRDEYYHRPTEALHMWTEAPMAAGRDLSAGGTWLGVSRSGRWAALTNIPSPPGRASRGHLVSEFLQHRWDTPPNLEDYAGFNLLLGFADQVSYYSSHAPHRVLDRPGIYGLSNATLDTPWPKLEFAKQTVQQHMGKNLSPSQWLDLFAYQGPDPGLGSVFVTTPDYGTRCTSLIHIQGGLVTMVERSYPEAVTRRVDFALEPSGSA